MNKINYDRMCMAVIRQQTAAGRVPTLLLHSCCAPCSSATLEWLSQYFQITVFYYNPNIYPESEYSKRIIEQLLTFGSDIFHQYRHKEHALIAAL